MFIYLIVFRNNIYENVIDDATGGEMTTEQNPN